MIHNNEHFYLLGMHGGWGIFILIIVILIVGWAVWARKRK